MKRDFTYIDDVVDGIHNVIRIKIKRKICCFKYRQRKAR